MSTTALAPRDAFARTAHDLLAADPSAALVYAEISGAQLAPAAASFPDRVVNVGIREQLLVDVASGLGMAGLRPIAHTFSSFLAERAFEQVKLGFGHNGVDGVLVSYGGSFDVSAGGRTHQAPGDVTLMDTVPGMSIHAPSTSSEVDRILRECHAAAGVHYVRVVDQQNARSFGPGLHVVRAPAAGRPTIVVLGPLLDAALEAVADLDVGVVYSATVRPFPASELREVVDGDVVLVEPWLAGTSAWAVSEALADRPHRLLALGVGRRDLRRYGTPVEHVAAHGLDAAGLAASVRRWLDAA